MCSSCASIRWVSSLVFSMSLMWSYGSTKRIDSNLGLWWEIVALGGPERDISTFLLNYLGLYPCLWSFSRSCYITAFFLISNSPLKGHVYNFSSCCINNYLTYLLSIPHPKMFSFGYGGYMFLDLSKDLDWYSWPVCLWMCWPWFGPLFLWKVLSKFLSEIGSIMV